MADSPMLNLLQAGVWGSYAPHFQRLSRWEHYPMLLQTLEQLDHSVLFVSKMHGLGHIERTILQGGFCAMEEGLDRVRLGDLDPSYLRRETSRSRAGLAFEVYRRYQQSIGCSPKPFFTQEELDYFRAHKNDAVPPTPPDKG